MALTKIENDALSNTVTANIASLAIGANVSINSSAFFVGNSTVNTVMTASGLVIANNFGVSSNTTNFLENRGGQLFFNSRRVKIINPYAPGSSAVYGYALGGYSGAYVATADRITFSTSATAASTVSNLSQARAYPAGMSDCAVYGYTLGGVDGTIRSTADRTTFSTGATAASTVSNVSQARYVLSGFSDGAVYGYAMGGYTGAAVATADRITFSTSVTAASTISNLSAARWGPITISDGAIYGYALGGYNGSSMLATGDRTAFSTGATAASTISNLSTVRYYGVGAHSVVAYG